MALGFGAFRLAGVGGYATPGPVETGLASENVSCVKETNELYEGQAKARSFPELTSWVAQAAELRPKISSG